MQRREKKLRATKGLHRGFMNSIRHPITVTVVSSNIKKDHDQLTQKKIRTSIKAFCVWFKQNPMLESLNSITSAKVNGGWFNEWSFLTSKMAKFLFWLREGFFFFFFSKSMPLLILLFSFFVCRKEKESFTTPHFFLFPFDSQIFKVLSRPSIYC